MGKVTKAHLAKIYKFIDIYSELVDLSTKFFEKSINATDPKERKKYRKASDEIHAELERYINDTIPID